MKEEHGRNKWRTVVQGEQINGIASFAQMATMEAELTKGAS